MKRLLSVSATILLSALPSFAQVNAGLVQNKTAAVSERDNSKYTLTLETYVTGQTIAVTTTKTVPVDVVLILDVSGSMNTNYQTVGYIYKTDPTHIWKDTNKTEEVTNTLQAYRNGAGNLVGFHNGKWQVYSNGWTDISSTYITVYINGRSAVTAAACQFLDDLAADAAKSGNTHRAAVVTFSESGTKIFDFTDVSADTQALKEKVFAISYDSSGQTYPQYGFEVANTCLGSARSDAAKNVLFFTDGYPGSSNSSVDKDQADAAITKAVTTKTDKNATVFAVGYIANPIEDQNTFMNAVSSNYKNATDMTSLGESTGSNYYLTTNDVSQIVGYFETVTSAIVSGGAIVSLDEKTTIKDVVTSNFEIPSSATISDIYTYTSDCTGVGSDGIFTFSDTKTPITTLNVRIVIDSETKKRVVKVNGFDFSANFCGPRTVNGSTSYSGKKLIIEFDIMPIEGFTGGLNVATNTEGSGVFKDEAAADNADDQTGVDKTTGENEGAGSYPVPTIVAPMDLIVAVTGMKQSESVVFKVTRSLNSDGSSPESSFSYKVMLTGTADTSDEVSATLHLVDTAKDNDKTKPYYYTVSTEGWEWAYSRTSGDTGNTHTLSLDDGTANNKFSFSRTNDTSKPHHGETTQSQIVTVK